MQSQLKFNLRMSEPWKSDVGLNGLSILKVDADYLRNSPSNAFELIEHGNQVYALNGNGWTGFVVGGENVFFKDFDARKFVALPLT